MASSELDPALEVPVEGLKRRRADDDPVSENVESAVTTPNTDIRSSKKFRPDNADEAKEAVKVLEEASQEERPHGNDQAEDLAEVTELTEEGDAQEEKHTADDAGAKDLSDQDEDVLAGADDGDDVDEDGENVKQDNGKDIGTNEHAKEVKLGPKVFTSSLEMLNFFYDLLRGWPLNFNLNKYEYMMLEDLIRKGHQDPQKKIGAGIEAFQIQVNPDFYSRCYYVIRKDGSVEDFSYRKCVDRLMPLPDNVKAPHHNKKTGRKDQGGHKGQHENKSRGGRFGRGGGHGRGNRGHGSRKKF